MIEEPKIIQGGMGVGVSGWLLARAVSMLGQLGVVSGTLLDVTLARRLQLGDPGGHVARAMAAFPFPEIARRVWDRYFVDGGKAEDKPFANLPMHSLEPPPALVELTVLGNFVEVWLAKEGHEGVVGINYLEKIQLPTLPSLFGAMLAGVSYVLMGAGIPRAIPGIIDELSRGNEVRQRIDVEGALAGEESHIRFDPVAFCGGTAPKLHRPKFLAIISSATLALTLAKKSSGKVDGFVVEGPVAGGHNAPPRGTMQLSDLGEPVYGDRDVPDLEKIAALGLPFWLAGSYAHPDRVKEAIALGAKGVQVGTAFAFCEESGADPDIRRMVLAGVRDGSITVFTDPTASPTGFPFKLVRASGTLSDAPVYEARERVCDLGYLRHSYRKDDGSVGFRCPAEPVAAFVKKGGTEAGTVGRICLCNGLLATIGLSQIHGNRGEEPPVLTAGDDLVNIARFLPDGRESYNARDVLEYLLGKEAVQAV